MIISELIEELEAIRAESGDVEVFTDDYTGGEYDLREPNLKVRKEDSRAACPCVVLNA